MTQPVRDHGGGLDAAIANYGGPRKDWVDLSTGINPEPYPIPEIAQYHWNNLPDERATQSLVAAARKFWGVPENAAVVAAPGASALIARIPALRSAASVAIPTPTYNEHAAAFTAAGWQVGSAHKSKQVEACVLVHPNNPTGRWYTKEDIQAPLTIIDESFCDIAPQKSFLKHADTSGRVILKSFGKFWGLAGLRLGFAIGDPDLIAKLSEDLGPWPVSGPALAIGTTALNDALWADQTRQRLAGDATRLDAIMTNAGAEIHGGTSLFRLYKVDDAQAWQSRLAQHHIWTRIFPYSTTFIRLGLPPVSGWPAIKNAL